jgi:hypothetical protein
VVLPSSVQDVKFGKAQGAGRKAQGIQHREIQLAGGSSQQAISVSQYAVGASFACDLNDLNNFSNFLIL